MLLKHRTHMLPTPVPTPPWGSKRPLSIENLPLMALVLSLKTAGSSSDAGLRSARPVPVSRGAGCQSTQQLCCAALASAPGDALAQQPRCISRPHVPSRPTPPEQPHAHCCDSAPTRAGAGAGSCCPHLPAWCQRARRLRCRTPLQSSPGAAAPAGSVRSASLRWCLCRQLVCYRCKSPLSL